MTGSVHLKKNGCEAPSARAGMWVARSDNLDSRTFPSTWGADYHHRARHLDGCQTMKKKAKGVSVLAPPYPRPPILEAVIGITFEQPLKEAALATADRRFEKIYASHQDNAHLNLRMNTFMGANNLPVIDTQGQRVAGHRRMSPGNDEVAVLMPDSLTVSQLAPYHGWAAFMARFKRDLHLYKRPGVHRAISRVGLRYINRIDVQITGNVVELENYLNLYPRVPDAMGPIAAYAMQTTFALENIGCIATLNSTPVPSPTLHHTSFMMDIDVYKSSELPVGDDALFALLEQMRAEKNRIFEACITQRAREELFGHAQS